MKKILAILVAAVMLLSLAGVAMAEETVTLGYELLDKQSGELHGFKPAFIVKLNEAK